MSEISILDLQNLRHLIGDLKPASAKCRTMPQKPKILKSASCFRMLQTVL